jgi:hypothetical protein
VKTKSAFSILALLLASGILYGGISAPASIAQLEQTADLIAVGTASRATVSGATVDFTLQVARVVKGDASLVGSAVPVLWRTGGQFPGGSSAGLNGSGIWFLHQTTGVWNLIPVTEGATDFARVYFPGSSGPIASPYAYAPTASLGDKLASEMASAIEGSTTFVQQFNSAMAGGLLDELNSPVLALLYARLGTSTSPHEALLGMAGLIRQQNGSMLAAAAQASSSLANDPDLGVLLLSIRVFFRATDPASVAALGVAATNTSNPNVGFREAAAHALSAIHTATAMPFLAALLDDPDTNLRVEAVGGMGAFANGLAVQTLAGVPGLTYLQLPDTAPYKTPDTVAHLAFGPQTITARETYYVSFWKTWWAQYGASLGN